MEDALKGARDIIAEHGERTCPKTTLHNAFARPATLTAKVVKGKEKESDQIPQLLRLLRIVKTMQLT